MTTVKKTKAENLLGTSKSVKSRAAQYASRIKTTLNNKIIVKLEEEIEAIDDRIFDLEDFSLKTDKNAGQIKLTKEACQNRFEEIIDLKYKKDMLTLKLTAKTKAFNELFGTD